MTVFTKIPMCITYETNKRAWEWRCKFIYDGDVETMFGESIISKNLRNPQ